MATNRRCRFCQLIRGEIENYTVFEDNLSLAFLDYRPLFPGHCLIVPKDHYETITDLPGSLIGPLFNNVKLLAHAVEKGLLAEGSFVAINNRVSQSVPHLHIHVVPRRKNDNLRGFFSPRQTYKDKDAIFRIQTLLRSTITKLRSQLAGSKT